MRKLSVVLLAALLVFVVAGQAMAAFENNHLVQVTYNEAQNEAGVDLGDIGAMDFSASNVLLAPAGTVPWGSLLGVDQLSLGFFGADNTTYQNWFATTEMTAPTINVGGFSNFQGQAAQVQAGYDSIDVGGIAVASAGATQSYDQLMNDGSTTPGGYAGFNTDWQVGESPLGVLSTVGYVDMYLYHYDVVTLDKGPDGNTDYTGILRLYADGSTVLNPQAVVPIPGAAILLGSGLIGLVGIRRRSA
jgi:hypothetical protein